MIIYPAYRSCFSEQGFTLLEVMISIFVFTIGLLGLASLQIFNLRLSGDSLSRTIAAIQANDMIDRMRANVAATTLGTASPYNNPTGASTANTNCLGKNGSGGLIDTQCNATQMARHDFYEWNTNLGGSAATGWHPQITATLPQGRGIVCIDSTPNDGTTANAACDNALVAGKPVFAVKIWWVERKDQNSPGTVHRYVTNFSL